MVPESLYPGCRLLLPFLLVAATAIQAGEGRPRAVDLDRARTLRILEGTITGREIVEYQVAGERFQVLSVDLMTSNSSAYFNILPAGADDAIFIGSTRGNVADVSLPGSGDYVIRLYLMRSAARRGETARYSLAVSLGPQEFADSLSGGPDYWSVSGIGAGSLNLRAGPGTRYPRVSRLSNGEVLQNQGCRLTGSERWCAIRASHSGVRGWVAGRYLIEAAAPDFPGMPEGGPIGNGTPFDATGYVVCVTAPARPAGKCPFGVIRRGPGNAGVWIALGNGAERHILFEHDEPVATNVAGAPGFEKAGDVFVVRIGDERYEIPEAIVNGG